MTKITKTYMAALLGLLVHYDSMEAAFLIVDVSGQDVQQTYNAAMTMNAATAGRFTDHVMADHPYETYELRFGSVLMGIITVFWGPEGEVIEVFSRPWS